MIGYITLGSNNIQRASSFYDAFFAEMGAARFMETDTFVAWNTSPGTPGLSVTKPFNGESASVGNGTMVALTAENKETVAALHSKALELGATDEGAPGPRGSDGFYAAYFRDLDDNKLCVFCFG